MYLGTAKVDITPKEQIPLAGFSSRMGRYEKVESNIFARVATFSSDGSDSGVAIVSADLIWWGEDITVSIRKRAKKIAGLQNLTIILHATHNHSSPQTAKNLSPLLGKYDEDYLEYLEDTIIDAILRSIINMERVVASYGEGECTFNVNRRFKGKKSAIRIAPNFDGIRDTALKVIRFECTAGNTKAVFMHYACHPTINKSNLLTGEFPNACCRMLEDEGVADIAIFLQGFCGDVRPALVKGQDFFAGDISDTYTFGRYLFDETMHVLSEPMESLNEKDFVTKEVEFTPTFDKNNNPLSKKSIASEEHIAEWVEFLTANDLEDILSKKRVRLTVFSPFQSLSFLTVNAEVVTEYHRYIQEIAGNEKVVTLGYTNGMVGYIPTAGQIAEKGYESYDSNYYFFNPSALHPSIEEELKKNLRSLLHTCRRT